MSRIAVEFDKVLDADRSSRGRTGHEEEGEDCNWPHRRKSASDKRDRRAVIE